jgi:hypothetical protein
MSTKPESREPLIRRRETARALAETERLVVKGTPKERIMCRNKVD